MRLTVRLNRNAAKKDNARNDALKKTMHLIIYLERVHLAPDDVLKKEDAPKNSDSFKKDDAPDASA